ncbi:glycerol-3-phosphate acyltransferase 4-like [Diadema antillarum]|uniref:glycerol-3-phosphate acyltransferase 4-like n=1 Tax=Diadema antillarum TaxID=105358 RepID=UPI003A88351C
MAISEQFIFVVIGFVISPFLILLAAIIVPACFGVSLGIRRLYIHCLLKLFEFGKQRVMVALETSNDAPKVEVESEDEEEVVQTRLMSKNGSTLIHKDSPKHLADGIKAEAKGLRYNRSFDTFRREFELADVCYFCRKGVEAIVEDEVTKRFSAEELGSWNLLTRTSMRYQYLSLRLTVLWFIGCLFRYCFLLPLRLAVLSIAVSYLFIFGAFLGYFPDWRIKKTLTKYITLTIYRIACRSFSALITYHNRENRAVGGGICVANHTSPIDVLILSSDNSYAFIGQKHTKFLGMIQKAMRWADADHIWFERTEMRDRKKVTQTLRQHVEDASKMPMLIFPEGTCINNTSVMMFKKGSFEIGGRIYPVAIKYDPRFGDAFWNSSRYSMVRYLLMMMTSWALVVEVWYLPPMDRGENESAVDFANRVKAAIARQGGLVDLVWDGQLKRMSVKQEYREKEQEEYSKLLKGD